MENTPAIDYTQHRRVWLNDPIYKGSFAPKYLGPYDVESVQYPVVTLIKDGTPYKVNVDRLKPCFELKSLTGYEQVSVDMDDDTLQLPALPIQTSIPIPTQPSKGEGASGGTPSANSQTDTSPKQERVIDNRRVTFEQDQLLAENPRPPQEELLSRPASPTPPVDMDYQPLVRLDRISDPDQQSRQPRESQVRSRTTRSGRPVRSPKRFGSWFQQGINAIWGSG